MSAGFFVDWNGDLRSTDEPGGGYHCDVDLPARYVAILSKNGALIHEATFYKTEADLEKAGIKAKLVPGSHPWAAPKDGF
ncbi:hypothetical protein [Rhodoblastus sp.]|jgi:hypothetical protein|uniref:hypothetical protein n=1 Tax=Rhodoblastus sp. TaxID=1962975 RepID=UPI0025D52A1F|nr:hypothetical protein [Rhodoblastus sp.]